MGDDGLTLGPVRHIALGAATHPFLRDHEIAGTPVVPVAMVLEWFASTAAGWRNRPKTLVLRGIRAIQQIALTGFPDREDQFTMRTHEVDDSLSLLLTGPRDVPHYRASACRYPLPVQRHAWSVPRDLRPAERSIPHDSETLAHGPAFRSIRRVSGISPTGAFGVVAGLTELGWPDGEWQLDPAALEGGVQLAVLWAARTLGGQPFPMAVRECHVRVPGPITGSARCIVRRRRTTPADAECDLALLGTGGEALVELNGVRFVRPEHRRSGR